MNERMRRLDGGIAPGWLTVFTSTIGMCVGPSALLFVSLGVFAPYLRHEFGWSLRDIGFAAMQLSIMTMIVSPLQGLLIDRFGARRIILTSMPLFGLGYSMMALLSGRLWEFYLGWAALSLLGIGLWPASWVKITSSWFEHRLGLAIGIATSGIGISGILLPLTIHALAEWRGWRSAFVVIGLSSVVVVWPLVSRFLRDGHVRSTPNTSMESEDTFTRRSTLWLLAGAFLLLGAYSVSILTHLVSILSENGMSLATATQAQAALGGFLIVGRLASGYVVDRISVRIVVPIFAATAVVALIALASGASGAIAIAAAALAGLLLGAEIDILGFVVKRYFGLKRYGVVYGGLFAVFQLGGAIGVLLFGELRERSGDYGSALTGLAFACATAGLLFTLIGPYRFHHSPSSRKRSDVCEAGQTP